MKKLIAIIMLAVLAIGAFSACSVVKDEPDAFRIGTLKGPTGMGMAKMMKDNEESKEYSFEIFSSPDEIRAALISGSLDAAALPVNLAAVIFNKTEGQYKIAAVNTMGVLYVLEAGDTIHSIEDLRGKTIYATGQGSTPEYTLRYLLTANGIDPDNDVVLEFKAEHAEVATLMSSGDVVLGMLPEPNVTTVLSANPDVRIALDLTAEWDKLENSGKLVQGCVVVSSEFASKYPESVKKMLDQYEASVKFVNENLDEASELIASYGIVPKAALAKKAIPNCNIVLIRGDEMKTMLNGFFSVLFNSNPASVGGKLPDESIYLEEK